jgi:3-phenylpropionate/trans-cinnamate dioxygenase ferredoxin reductase component
LTLRTLDDALALRDRLQRQADVAVMGAGWIGAEVASSATALGCRVTVVEAQRAPPWPARSARQSARIAECYEESGVRLVLGSGMSRLLADAVELAGGERLACDTVVAGIGVTPSTQCLAGALDLDGQGGILVDPYLETSAPGAYAIGDCAAYISRRYGRRLRPEHWTNAQQSEWTAAATLLGGREAYDPVPYIWSRQFGRMVQYVGQHSPGDEMVWREAAGNPGWSVRWVRDGVLTAVLAAGRQRDAAEARRLLAAGVEVEVSRLRDASARLGTACTTEMREWTRRKLAPEEAPGSQRWQGLPRAHRDRLARAPVTNRQARGPPAT